MLGSATHLVVKLVLVLALYLGRYHKDNDKVDKGNFWKPGKNLAPVCNIALFAFSLHILLAAACELKLVRCKNCAMMVCCVLSVAVFLRALLTPWIASWAYDGEEAQGKDAVLGIKDWGPSMWMLFVLAVVCVMMCVAQKMM